MPRQTTKNTTEENTNSRAKRWCYTLNNPIQPIAYNELTQDYHVYGEEVGDSGTPHHQGFVVFKNLKRLTQLKEINSRAHWEPARGSNKEASDYCKKDGKYHEYGTLPDEPGTKSKRVRESGNKANSDKWKEISDWAKAGKLSEIDNKYPKPFVNCYRNLQAIRKDHTPKVDNLADVCGIWIYGESGVGKTRLITKLYPDAYLKRMNKWYDGYNGEDVIVLDDLDPSHSFMGYELKKLADRYCFLAEIKNASMYIRPKRVVVTSQYPIEAIWREDKETTKALKRRFKIIHATEDNINLLLNTKDNYKNEDDEEDKNIKIDEDEDEEEVKEVKEVIEIKEDEEVNDVTMEELIQINEMEKQYFQDKMRKEKEEEINKQKQIQIEKHPSICHYFTPIICSTSNGERLNHSE